MSSPESSLEKAALPPAASVVVVGGGIAGLASAWQLAELGVPDVLLLEAEDALASHASGRNAAIFLPLEESLSAVWLAARTRDLLDQRIGTSWLSAHGITLVSARAEALEELRFTARRLGVYHDRWSGDELGAHNALLRDGECTEALHLPLGGVMDTRLVLARMKRWAVAAGARIATGVRVASVRTESGRVTGVQLEDGRTITSERVVLAAGAWGGQLGSAAGSALALKPLRRHLAVLEGSQHPSSNGPVTWRVDVPFYFRPEAGGLLASPCDEAPSEPGAPETDPAVIASIQALLAKIAPSLALDLEPKRSWACLRTVTQDRELAVGADVQVKGLHWCAGLGGRGMAAGAAAGELLARSMLGLAHPLTRPLSPERF